MERVNTLHTGKKLGVFIILRQQKSSGSSPGVCTKVSLLAARNHGNYTHIDIGGVYVGVRETREIGS